MTKKCIFILNWFGLEHTGGIEVYNKHLCENLYRNFEITYFYGEGSSKLSKKFKTEQVGFMDRCDNESNISIKGIENADLVIINNPNVINPEKSCKVLQLIKKKKPNVPIVASIHNINIKNLDSRFLDYIDCIQTCSPFMIKSLKKVYRTKIPIFELPYIIKLPNKSEIKKVRLKPFKILQPTRFCNWKGSYLSLRAILELLDEGLDIVYTHAGVNDYKSKWDERWDRSIVNKINQYVSQNKIKFIKYKINQVYETLSSNHLIIHPTLGMGIEGDPNPISLQEAAIINSNIICTASGNSKNIVESVSQKIIIKPNIEDLKKAIKIFYKSDKVEYKILKETKLYNQLSKAIPMHIEKYNKLCL